jgi:hypothetical protein
MNFMIQLVWISNLNKSRQNINNNNLLYKLIQIVLVTNQKNILEKKMKPKNQKINPLHSPKQELLKLNHILIIKDF